MHDDDQRVPERRGFGWSVLLAGGAAAVVAVAIAAVVFLNARPAAVGDATPSAVTSRSAAVAIPSVSAPSPGEAAGTPTPSPIPSQPAAIPENWIAVDTFSEPGKRYALGDLATWSGGLVAVGTLYESEGRGVFGPPPPHGGRVWRSTDGTHWTDETPDNTFQQVELRHLFERADGALIVIGDVFADLDPTSAAWESRDGESWEPVVLAGMPADALVARVASGARGHLAITHVGAETHALHSTDGRHWEPTLTDASVINDLGAGDDGFTASIFKGDPSASTAAIVASSDGLEWIDGIAPDGGAFRVVPRGGDWFAVTYTFGDAISLTTWQSANGLEWSRLGDMALGSVEFPDVRCSEAPAAIHGLPRMVVVGTALSGPCSEGAVVAAGASYASLDGTDWTRLPFGDQAFAAGAVVVGERVVVATDSRTNRASTIGVTFWISEAP